MQLKVSLYKLYIQRSNVYHVYVETRITDVKPKKLSPNESDLSGKADLLPHKDGGVMEEIWLSLEQTFVPRFHLTTAGQSGSAI